MPRRASGSSRTKSVDETKRSTIRFSCTRFNSSAFCENANPDEDWTKIPDLAERRRIQNRIAQRNYRKKLKQRMDEHNSPEASSDNDVAMSRKPSGHGSSSSPPGHRADGHWRQDAATLPSSSTSASAVGVAMISPTFSDSGSSFDQGTSLFSGRCSDSPPALSVDEESPYDHTRTHSSSIASTGSFTDDMSFPMAMGSSDRTFGDIADWSLFDSGFTFDPSSTWNEPSNHMQPFLEPLQTQFYDKSPMFSASGDGQQSSLKSDPMLGFDLEPSADYFTQSWSPA